MNNVVTRKALELGSIGIRKVELLRWLRVERTRLLHLEMSRVVRSVWLIEQSLCLCSHQGLAQVGRDCHKYDCEPAYAAQSHFGRRDLGGRCEETFRAGFLLEQGFEDSLVVSNKTCLTPSLVHRLLHLSHLELFICAAFTYHQLVFFSTASSLSSCGGRQWRSTIPILSCAGSSQALPSEDFAKSAMESV